MSAFAEITYIIEELFAARSEALPEMTPRTTFGDIGIDSLDIASVAAVMEEKTGLDPFANPSLPYFPQNLGEFADLYSTDESG
jgi:hypothetical protein